MTDLQNKGAVVTGALAGIGRAAAFALATRIASLDEATRPAVIIAGGHPGDDFGSPVILRFGPQPAKKARPLEPDAWVKALVLLKLYPKGDWDPAEEYWGESGDPIEDWAKPIIKRGPRPMYEMEVLPGTEPEDFDSDPKVLERLLVMDVRCLDAHARLVNISFDKQARTALEHHQRGVLIGELSLGEKFEGVLPWGMIDNRPFLRCAIDAQPIT
jgi:hypothetical protein